MKVDLYQSEIAFSLSAISEHELDKLHERLATQYADVAVVYEGICNPALVTITFSDVPTEKQLERIKHQIKALTEL